MSGALEADAGYRYGNSDLGAHAVSQDCGKIFLGVRFDV